MLPRRRLPARGIGALVQSHMRPALDEAPATIRATRLDHARRMLASSIHLDLWEIAIAAASSTSRPSIACSGAATV
jgi:hypothetical protein